MKENIRKKKFLQFVDDFFDKKCPIAFQSSKRFYWMDAIIANVTLYGIDIAIFSAVFTLNTF